MSNTDWYLAHSYALALFEYINKEDNVIHEANIEQLTCLVSVIRPYKIYFNKSSPMHVLQDLYDEVEQKLNKVLRNFFKLIIENKRTYLINNILISYKTMYYTARNEQVLVITSATKLKESEITLIVNKLNIKFNTVFIAEVKIQEDLLDGMILRFGDTLIDLSLRGKMESIADNVGSLL